jgi:hypothetical protein
MQKMTRSWKKTLGMVAMAVAVFALIAVNVQARPATHGHFELPYEVQWGSVALPAGDYTFSIDHLTASGQILLYRGNQAAGIVRWQDMENDQKLGSAGELLCVRHDGRVTVRALELPDVGTLYFALPKGMKTLVAQQPELIEAVSVQVGGE